MPKFTVSKRARVYLRDRFACRYCGRSALKGELSVLDLTLDHLNPQATGGTDSVENLLTCCQRCNEIRGSAVFDTVQETSRFIAKQQAKREKRLITSALAQSGDPVDRFDLLDLLFTYNRKEVVV